MAVGAVLGLGEQAGGAAVAVAEPSAITTTSLGPAGRSMPTDSGDEQLRRGDVAFPGPTIRSTRGIDSVPYASAATAWAPPIA